VHLALSHGHEPADAPHPPVSGREGFAPRTAGPPSGRPNPGGPLMGLWPLRPGRFPPDRLKGRSEDPRRKLSAGRWKCWTAPGRSRFPSNPNSKT